MSKCSDCTSISRITKEQADELAKLTAPVSKFIRDNVHPHAYVMVSVGNSELLEGMCTANNLEE